MKSIDFARQFIANKGFAIKDENEDCLMFDYQMNPVQLWWDTDEDDYLMITMPVYSGIDDDQQESAKQLCTKLNTQIRQVKLYVVCSVIVAGVEIYFMGEEDFNFQMEKALENLISAKVKFKYL